MKTNIIPEIKEVMEAVHYRPAVSIIMPFEQKMNLKTETLHSLKIATDKVENELSERYPGELGKLVMNRLRALIRDIEIDTSKKSIAIFISPVFEKVMFLDVAVEERIIIDESFEIRDLVYSKKQLDKYLVLLLSSKEGSILIWDSTTLGRLKVNRFESVSSAVPDVPERVANFSDLTDQKEIMMHKFLHQIDHSLNTILNAYHLPVFVIGTDRIMGHFKTITRHAGAVIGYIPGNYEDSSVQELKALLDPYVSEWKKAGTAKLFDQLDEAAGKKKLAVGIRDVWRAAMNLKGRLLVVERNYMHPLPHEKNDTVVTRPQSAFNASSFRKDAVDEIIEKVLENGGDVEFVDEGMLKDFNRIALIQFYE